MKSIALILLFGIDTMTSSRQLCPFQLLAQKKIWRSRLYNNPCQIKYAMQMSQFGSKEFNLSH